MRATHLALLLLAAQTDVNDLAWPRQVKVPEGTITLYQPQIESFEDDRITGRAAVSVKLPNAPEPVFGALWFAARIATDRAARTYECQSIEVTNARFPKAKPESRQKFEQARPELERQAQSRPAVNRGVPRGGRRR